MYFKIQMRIVLLSLTGLGLRGLQRSSLRLLQREHLGVLAHDAVLGVHVGDAVKRRDDREQVVDLVRADVVAQVVDERAVRAIDGREVSLDVGPFRVGVPWGFFVVVVL